MIVVRIFSPMTKRNLSLSTLCLSIICCITRDTETSGTFDDDGYASNGDDNGWAGDRDNDCSLRDDDDLGGTALVTEVKRTCLGRGSNCVSAFIICLHINFGIAATNWLYPSESCGWW